MSLLKIFLIAFTLLSPQGKWQRIHTSEQISFLLPNFPQKLKETVNGIPSTIYQTKDLTCVAGVVCSDLSDKNIRLTEEVAAALYEELKAGTLNLKTAMLKKETTVPDERMLIKELEYTLIKDRFEMTYFKRFIFRGNYIYQLSIGGRTRHRDIIEQEKETFFNSVFFSEKKKNE